MIEINELLELYIHLHGLKVIIFDLDDTLYSEKEYVRSGYRAIARMLPEVVQMEEKLWQAFEQNKPAIDEVLTAEGLHTDALKQTCLAVYRAHQPDIHFFEGATELLLRLRADGYMLGVITDGRPEGQRAKIKALGLDALVDYIIVTDELGGVEYRKPNCAAFIRMQEMFAVPFEEMCYIGDNIKKDFIAPKKLGMKCIYFKNADGLYHV